MAEEPRIAVFVDFENLALGARGMKGGGFDIKLVGGYFEPGSAFTASPARAWAEPVRAGANIPSANIVTNKSGNVRMGWSCFAAR